MAIQISILEDVRKLEIKEIFIESVKKLKLQTTFIKCEKLCSVSIKDSFITIFLEQFKSSFSTLENLKTQYKEVLFTSIQYYLKKYTENTTENSSEIYVQLLIDNCELESIELLFNELKIDLVIEQLVIELEASNYIDLKQFNQNINLLVDKALSNLPIIEPKLLSPGSSDSLKLHSSVNSSKSTIPSSTSISTSTLEVNSDSSLTFF
jgi:hypothetical protein